MAVDLSTACLVLIVMRAFDGVAHLPPMRSRMLGKTGRAAAVLAAALVLLGAVAVLVHALGLLV